VWIELQIVGLVLMFRGYLAGAEQGRLVKILGSLAATTSLRTNFFMIFDDLLFIA